MGVIDVNVLTEHDWFYKSPILQENVLFATLAGKAELINVHSPDFKNHMKMLCTDLPAFRFNDLCDFVVYSGVKEPHFLVDYSQFKLRKVQELVLRVIIAGNADYISSCDPDMCSHLLPLLPFYNE